MNFEDERKRIYAVIEEAGDDGVTLRDICKKLYPEKNPDLFETAFESLRRKLARWRKRGMPVALYQVNGSRRLYRSIRNGKTDRSSFFEGFKGVKKRVNSRRLERKNLWRFRESR